MSSYFIHAFVALLMLALVIAYLWVRRTARAQYEEDEEELAATHKQESSSTFKGKLYVGFVRGTQKGVRVPPYLAGTGYVIGQSTPKNWHTPQAYVILSGSWSKQLRNCYSQADKKPASEEKFHMRVRRFSSWKELKMKDAIQRYDDEKRQSDDREDKNNKESVIFWVMDISESCWSRGNAEAHIIKGWGKYLRPLTASSTSCDKIIICCSQATFLYLSKGNLYQTQLSVVEEISSEWTDEMLRQLTKEKYNQDNWNQFLMNGIVNELFPGATADPILAGFSLDRWTSAIEEDHRLWPWFLEMDLRKYKDAPEGERRSTEARKVAQDFFLSGKWDASLVEFTSREDCLLKNFLVEVGEQAVSPASSVQYLVLKTAWMEKENDKKSVEALWCPTSSCGHYFKNFLEGVEACATEGEVQKIVQQMHLDLLRKSTCFLNCVMKNAMNVSKNVLEDLDGAPSSWREGTRMQKEMRKAWLWSSILGELPMETLISIIKTHTPEDEGRVLQYLGTHARGTAGRKNEMIRMDRNLLCYLRHIVSSINDPTETQKKFMNDMHSWAVNTVMKELLKPFYELLIPALGEKETSDHTHTKLFLLLALDVVDWSVDYFRRVDTKYLEVKKWTFFVFCASHCYREHVRKLDRSFVLTIFPEPANVQPSETETIKLEITQAAKKILMSLRIFPLKKEPTSSEMKYLSFLASSLVINISILQEAPFEVPLRETERSPGFGGGPGNNGSLNLNGYQIAFGRLFYEAIYKQTNTAFDQIKKSLRSLEGFQNLLMESHWQSIKTELIGYYVQHEIPSTAGEEPLANLRLEELTMESFRNIFSQEQRKNMLDKLIAKGIPVTFRGEITSSFACGTLLWEDLKNVQEDLRFLKSLFHNFSRKEDPNENPNEIFLDPAVLNVPTAGDHFVRDSKVDEVLRVHEVATHIRRRCKRVHVLLGAEKSQRSRLLDCFIGEQYSNFKQDKNAETFTLSVEKALEELKTTIEAIGARTATVKQMLKVNEALDKRPFEVEWGILRDFLLWRREVGGVASIFHEATSQWELLNGMYKAFLMTHPIVRSLQNEEGIVMEENDLKEKSLEELKKIATDRLMRHFPGYELIEAKRLIKVMTKCPLLKGVWDYLEGNEKELINMESIEDVVRSDFNKRIVAQLGFRERTEDDSLLTLKTEGPFVAALVKFRKDNTLMELSAHLKNTPAFFRYVDATVNENDFDTLLDKLAALSESMPAIQRLFNSTLDPLDQMVRDTREIQKGGYAFLFDLESERVELGYTDTGKELAVKNSTDLQELQRLLYIFTQDSSSGQTTEDRGSIMRFCETVFRFLEPTTMEILCELHASCAPNFSKERIAVVFPTTEGTRPPWVNKLCDNNYQEVPNSDMMQLKAVLEDWKAEVQKEYQGAHILVLLGLKVAHQVYQEVIQDNWRNAPLLQHFFQPVMPYFSEVRFSADQHATAANLGSTQNISWIQRFVTTIQNMLAHQGNRDPDSETVEQRRRSDRKHCRLYCRSEEDVYKGIHWIYPERPPFVFETLWCTEHTSHPALQQLIEKAIRFPEYDFTIVHFELLQENNQESVLGRLIKENILNLWVIDCGAGCLQNSPSFPTIAMHRQRDHQGLETVQHRPHVASIKCFTGSSGSGKTYRMTKENTIKHCCRIVVAENFSLGRAVSLLCASLYSRKLMDDSIGSIACVVQIQFSCGKYINKDEAVWRRVFREVNWLVYSLFWVGGIQDPETGKVFCFPLRGNFTVHGAVELPPTDFLELFLKSAEAANNSLELFPMLRYAASVVSEVHCDAQVFEVNKSDLQLVGGMLKAYESGAIDQKKCISLPSDIVFAVNTSESMDEELEDRGGNVHYSGSPGGVYHSAALGRTPSTTTVLDKAKEILKDLLSLCAERDTVAGFYFSDRSWALWGREPWSPSNAKRWGDIIDELTPGISAGHTYKGLSTGIEDLTKLNLDPNRRKVVVVVTDNAEDDKALPACRELLTRSAGQIRLLVVTLKINRDGRQKLRERVCMPVPCEGISCRENIWKHNRVVDGEVREEVRRAFLLVRKETVSDRILLLPSERSYTEEELHSCLEKHMMELPATAEPDDPVPTSKTEKQRWLRFMVRFCEALIASDIFELNETKDGLGRAMIQGMLMGAHEVVALCHRSWKAPRNREVWIPVESKLFGSSLAVNGMSPVTWTVAHFLKDPERQSHEEGQKWAHRRQQLEDLGFVIPSREDLSTQGYVLESLLGHAVGGIVRGGMPFISIDNRHGSGAVRRLDFPVGELSVMREADHLFVLTQDFLLKMLSMNESVECRNTCLLEGETGVSKTKLTAMLFTVKNWSLVNPSKSRCCLQPFLLAAITSVPRHSTVRRWILVREWLKLPTARVANEEIEVREQDIDASLALRLREEIVHTLRCDPSLNPRVLSDDELKLLSHNVPARDSIQCLLKMLKWMCSLDDLGRRSEQENWFFEQVDVHSSVSAEDIEKAVTKMRERAVRLQLMSSLFPEFTLHAAAKVCLFFDECNTSSCMGVVKEILQDHSFSGNPLPENLIVVAACNPYRERLMIAKWEPQGQENARTHQSSVTEELPNSWSSGHYVVRPLPPVLDSLTWDFASLCQKEELEFIYRRLRAQLPNASEDLSSLIVDSVHRCQEFVRNLAVRQAREALLGVLQVETLSAAEERECIRRGTAAVSIRDIIRFFSFFCYFLELQLDLRILILGREDRDSFVTRVVLSLGLVYFLRLDTEGRKELNREICLDGKCIEGVLHDCVKRVFEIMKVEKDIIPTEGMQENLFSVLVHVHSKIPLIIKGPPGTSKTLAVHLFLDNAQGSIAPNALRHMCSYIPTRYQCSKLTTGKEIGEGIERAMWLTERQREYETDTESFFFMDEAGIPEEDKDSLKILHYYLEHNTHSKRTRVGFVALSNHGLDAAKTNRCNVVTRMAYDRKALIEIAKGCSNLPIEAREPPTKVMWRDQENMLTALPWEEVVEKICTEYERYIAEYQAHAFLFRGEEFIGTRGFMHFWKFIGWKARRRQNVDIQTLTQGMRRNFSGMRREKADSIISRMLSGFVLEKEIKRNNRLVQFEESFIERHLSNEIPLGRYHLITYATNDESVMHEILYNRPRGKTQHDANYPGVQSYDSSRPLVMISPFKNGREQEQLNAVARIKMDASKGHTMYLTHCDTIHEGLYDVFNQHFTVIYIKGEPRLMTTISEGANSILCALSPKAWWVVFCPLQSLPSHPPPFLDRLEKHRISMCDVLHAYLMEQDRNNKRSSWSIVREVVKPLLRKIEDTVWTLGWEAFYGLKAHESIESAVLALLRSWETKDLLEVGNTSDELLQAGEEQVLKMLLSVAIPEKALPRMSDTQRRLYFDSEKNFQFDPCGQRRCAQWGMTADEKGLVREGPFMEIVITRHIVAQALQSTLYTVLDMSHITASRDLEARLATMWASDHPLLFVVPLQNIDLLNYLRRHIETHFFSSGCGDQRKEVVIIGIAAMMDIAMNIHVYDTCFSSIWRRSFIDSVGEMESAVTWLRIGYDSKFGSDRDNIEKELRRIQRLLQRTVDSQQMSVPYYPMDEEGPGNMKQIGPDEIKKLLNKCMPNLPGIQSPSICAREEEIGMILARKVLPSGDIAEGREGETTALSGDSTFREVIRERIVFQSNSPTGLCLSDDLYDFMEETLTHLIAFVVHLFLPWESAIFPPSEESEREPGVAEIRAIFGGILGSVSGNTALNLGTTGGYKGLLVNAVNESRSMGPIGGGTLIQESGVPPFFPMVDPFLSNLIGDSYNGFSAYDDVDSYRDDEEEIVTKAMEELQGKYGNSMDSLVSWNMQKVIRSDFPTFFCHYVEHLLWTWLHVRSRTSAGERTMEYEILMKRIPTDTSIPHLYRIFFVFSNDMQRIFHWNQVLNGLNCVFSKKDVVNYLYTKLKECTTSNQVTDALYSWADSAIKLDKRGCGLLWLQHSVQQSPKEKQKVNTMIDVMRVIIWDFSFAERDIERMRSKPLAAFCQLHVKNEELWSGWTYKNESGTNELFPSEYASRCLTLFSGDKKLDHWSKWLSEYGTSHTPERETTLGLTLLSALELDQVSIRSFTHFESFFDEIRGEGDKGLEGLVRCMEECIAKDDPRRLRRLNYFVLCSLATTWVDVETIKLVDAIDAMMKSVVDKELSIFWLRTFIYALARDLVDSPNSPPSELHISSHTLLSDDAQKWSVVLRNDLQGRLKNDKQQYDALLKKIAVNKWSSIGKCVEEVLKPLNVNSTAPLDEDYLLCPPKNLFALAVERADTLKKRVTQAKFCSMLWVMEELRLVNRWAMAAARNVPNDELETFDILNNECFKEAIIRYKLLQGYVLPYMADTFNMPVELPPQPTVIDLVSTKNLKSDEVHLGKLQMVMSAILEKYVGEIRKPENIPTALDLKRLEDMLGTNNAFLSSLREAMSSPSKQKVEVQVKSANDLFNAHLKRFETTGDVAQVLRPLHAGMYLLEMAGPNSESAQEKMLKIVVDVEKGMKYLLHNALIEIPDALTNLGFLHVFVPILALPPKQGHDETEDGEGEHLPAHCHLLFLLHRLDYHGLSRLKKLVQRAMNEVTGLSTSKRLWDAVNEWVPQGGREWLATSIGLDITTTDRLLEEPVVNQPLVDFLDEQIKNKAYLCAHLPYELKNGVWDDSLRDQVEAALNRHSRRALLRFAYLLAQMESELESNALNTTPSTSHRLLDVLGKGFHSSEGLMLRHPPARDLNQLYDQEGSWYPLSTSDYVSLRLELHRKLMDQCDDTPSAPSHPHINDPDDEWSFLLYEDEMYEKDAERMEESPIDRADHNASEKMKMGRLESFQRERKLREDLQFCVENYSGTPEEIAVVQRLVYQVRQQDKDPLVDKALAILQSYREEVEAARSKLGRLRQDWCRPQNAESEESKTMVCESLRMLLTVLQAAGVECSERVWAENMLEHFEKIIPAPPLKCAPHPHHLTKLITTEAFTPAFSRMLDVE